jgi:hypothetical protein
MKLQTCSRQAQLVDEKKARTYERSKSYLIFGLFLYKTSQFIQEDEVFFFFFFSLRGIWALVFWDPNHLKGCVVQYNEIFVSETLICHYFWGLCPSTPLFQFYGTKPLNHYAHKSLFLRSLSINAFVPILWNKAP